MSKAFDAVARPESPSTILRFEDETDKHAPRLNYAVPLPGSYEARNFLELELGSLPWTDAALGGESKVPAITGGPSPDQPPLAVRLKENPNLIDRCFFDPGWIDPVPWNVVDPLRASGTHGISVTRPPAIEPIKSAAPTPEPTITPSASPIPGHKELVTIGQDNFLCVMNHYIPLAEIEAHARAERALVVYRAFGDTLGRTYIPNPVDKAHAHPRILIVEHYRLSSHLQDYGAGRTIATFSLWPGEDTRLYVRSWRRTEQRYKEASTIFDSYTSEAANEFESSLAAENSFRTAYETTKSWKASGGFGLNLGVFKIGGGGGGGGSSKSAREALAQIVSKVSTHHASKASAKRENSVTTELEASEAAEFERISERRVRNVNLSRTLNLVCRELNQEFFTYLSLIDMTIAFANDRGLYDEVPLYDVDRLLNKYVKDTWDGGAPNGAPSNPRKHIRDVIWKEAATVFDFQGKEKQFLEEADDTSGAKYWRVRRRHDPAASHPSYPDGKIPVEGVVIDTTRHTVRTDGIIVDALLGHGVALDNYALGTQQEVLLGRQIENKQKELALQIIESGDTAKKQAYRELLVCCARDFIKSIGEELKLSSGADTGE